MILVIGNITDSGDLANTKVAFKSCTPFKACRTEINDVFNNEADNIYIAVHMYNLIEYSDNHSDISGSLWQFKRNEIDDNANMNTTGSSSFKYK